MEPAALSGLESARVLAFLMSRPRPSADVVAAIEAGLAWIEAVKITGHARVKIDGKTDYVPDPASDLVLWARFYSLADGRPIFPRRDGVVYDSYGAMAAGNRAGSDLNNSSSATTPPAEAPITITSRLTPSVLIALRRAKRGEDGRGIPLLFHGMRALDHRADREALLSQFLHAPLHALPICALDLL